MGHLHKWLESLLVGLDGELDENARARILESCGRSCISRNFIKKAQRCKHDAENVEEFIIKLSRTWKHLRRENGDTYVVYEKCYCPLVRTYSGKLSPTFCNCSRGWIKELFESALQKPVDVELQKSIKHGDNICKFKVHL